MTNIQLTEWIESVFSRCPGNEISPDIALSPELAGEKIFEAPLVCVASAQDPLYEKLTQPDVIGPWHMGPEAWLPGAKAVISLFFPCTETIKVQQRKIPDRVSPAWLHGRIEGQSFIIAFTTALRDALQQQDDRYDRLYKLILDSGYEPTSQETAQAGMHQLIVMALREAWRQEQLRKEAG